jgi:hypothetical protein
MSLAILVVLIDIVGRNKKINRVIGTQQLEVLGLNVVGIAIFSLVVQVEVLKMLRLQSQRAAVFAIIGTATIVSIAPAVFVLLVVGILVIAGFIGHLSRSRDLNPGIVAAAVKDFETEDTLEHLPDLSQAPLGLLHALGHGRGRGRINIGADIEEPKGTDGLE